jgi:hypothetical protein
MGPEPPMIGGLAGDSLGVGYPVGKLFLPRELG